jgi:thiol-disulfide isomerase/thioredoxin
MARISHAMRFIPLFCALLLAIFSHPSLGKPKGGASRSDARQAKLASLAASGRGVISADSDLYNEVTSTPRNYSAAILLTALSPQFGCDPCVKFHPEYESVAKSWAKKKDDSHFFVSLDFNKGREIFQKVGCGLPCRGSSSRRPLPIRSHTHSSIPTAATSTRSHSLLLPGDHRTSSFVRQLTCDL